jgi:hypothetical protein
VESSIALKTDETPVPGTAAPTDPAGSSTPDASSTTTTTVAQGESTQAAPSTGSGTAPADGQGGRTRRRRGEGFGSESGSGLSKGIGSTAEPMVTEAPEETGSSAKPAERTQEDAKQITDLEQFAPLEPRGPLFGPKATVYKAKINFRVKIRDGAAQPAPAGANP